jgi:hypothetical protein
MAALNNDAKTSSVTRAWLDLERVLHNAPMLRSSWVLQIPSKGGDNKENTRNMVSGGAEPGGRGPFFVISHLSGD